MSLTSITGGKTASINERMAVLTAQLAQASVEQVDELLASVEHTLFLAAEVARTESQPAGIRARSAMIVEQMTTESLAIQAIAGRRKAA